MNVTKVVLALCAALFTAGGSEAHAAPTQADIDCASPGNVSPTTVIASKGILPATTTTNMKHLTVCGVNIFRFNSNLQTQTVVTAPPPGNPFQPHAAMVQMESPSYEILLLLVTSLQRDTLHRTENFLQRRDDAARKVACYNQLLQAYPDPLLSPDAVMQLKAALQPTAACGVIPLASWTDGDTASVQAAMDAVLDANRLLWEFQASQEYKTWLTADADQKAIRTADYAALFDMLKTTQAQLTELLNATAISSLNTAVITATFWDQRAQNVLADGAPWNQSAAIQCGVEWFGKNQGQTITLWATDYSVTLPSAPVTVFTVTNSCLARMTISSGLGISFVRNSTFGFVPKTDYTATPPVTTQVIGYASDSRITPLYVGQLNYAYLPHEKSVGLYVSGGAGVSSSSGSTTGDLFLGNAFSFFHRAIFVTPSVHLTQRQQLLSGYTVGSPATSSLSTVPTISSWKTGFAITFTFPVLQ